jgi:hypothetical protein
MPLSPEALAAKFRVNAARALPALHVEEALGRLLKLSGEPDAAAAAAALRGPS